eukprot:gnl/MRDRNA2_/MRDRNA2_89804_c0_seq1.p1 gnl/MRDRNA2_/MRDRNA2_89804_c0~~gnl/MRDRNA2_/MRDRNA2_89804_c0_seq1.p1  ORF type:complete len:239 (-),score=37.11 gnl/MRDRNA2_/MRDRNA2_89804_c0_seq1:37-753(-)
MYSIALLLVLITRGVLSTYMRGQRQEESHGQLPWQIFPALSDDRSASTASGDYASPPRHSASYLEFVDDDFTPGNLSGTIRIGMAADEADVTWYSLYWGQNDQKLPTSPLIQAIPKAGHDLEYRLGSLKGGPMEGSANEDGPSIGSRDIPRGATHLLVYTSNQRGGEQSQPIVEEIVDATSGWTLGLPMTHYEAIASSSPQTTTRGPFQVVTAAVEPGDEVAEEAQIAAVKAAIGGSS